MVQSVYTIWTQKMINVDLIFNLITSFSIVSCILPVNTIWKNIIDEILFPKRKILQRF